METKTVQFEERTAEECDLATLVGLCLAKRVLCQIPDGGTTGSAARFQVKKAIREAGDHNDRSRAYRIANAVSLPALDDQPKTAASPLAAWGDAIWEAIDAYRFRVRGEA